MSPRRRALAAVLVAVGAIIYGVSPVDVIPELLTGPLGLADDFAVLIGAGVGIYKLLSGRRSPGTDTGNVTPPPAA